MPRVPTFSVDKGFWYSIPGHLADAVVVGAQVRVPLGGRKVRGYVVDTSGSRSGPLKEVLAVSGGQPVFDEKTMQSLRWAAQHYVAPFSVLLDKAAPPTLPGAPQSPFQRDDGFPDAPPKLRGFAAAASEGARRPAMAFVANWQDSSWIEVAGPVLGRGMTCLVIAPTVKEEKRIAEMAVESFGEAVVMVQDATGSTLTRAWEQARRGGRLVVGTPRLAAWSLSHLGLVILVEEGRRAMKDRQTPTIHVRDLIRTRALIEGFATMFVGPTPSVELIASGAEVQTDSRPWGLVEVVNRTEDPPGGGFLSERTVTAIRSATSARGKTFVFTHRRASDSSVRCVSCRSVRRCRQCGSHVGNHPSCRRCGETSGPCANCGGKRFESMGSVPGRLIAEIGNRVGSDVVGEVDTDRQVVVGTERDLAGVNDFDLAVAVDVDALLFGQNYRASEEALRILARVIGSVRRGKGYRAILQTSAPDSDLVAALRRGDPIPYLESVLVDRARSGFPPATEMMAIEVRSDEGRMADGLLESAVGGMILGSVRTENGTRWLLQGDLRTVKTDLRATVQKLRDAGVTVRVDVDPIDL